MMSWTSTPKRSAVSALATLWCHPSWRSSRHAGPIREVLRAGLDNADDVIRLHTAQVARRLTTDAEPGFELVRDHLLVEKHPLVAALLLEELRKCGLERPAELDAVLANLTRVEPWSALLAETASDSDQREPLETLTALALVLAIRYQTPTAQQLVGAWLSAPVATAAAQHALVHLREWTELPLDQADERARAFDMLDTAIASLTRLRDAVAEDPDRQAKVYRTADLIARNINFASEAVEEREEDSSEDSEFAARAFVVLEGVAQFKHPSITHHLIEALDHLAAADPARAFHVAAAAVTTGDEYTYDSVAASETTKLIERYLAEFRDAVVSDDQLLTAIRSVLHAFVDAGWPSAIALAYRLSEAFR
jgi:hypothetical protein